MKHRPRSLNFVKTAQNLCTSEAHMAVDIQRFVKYHMISVKNEDKDVEMKYKTK